MEFFQHLDHVVASKMLYVDAVKYFVSQGIYPDDNGNIDGGRWDDRNSGFCNIGFCNIGDKNIGSHNKGTDNMGNGNVGDRNIGDYNKGDFNKGSFNKGSFMTGCNKIEGSNSCDNDSHDEWVPSF